MKRTALILTALLAFTTATLALSTNQVSAISATLTATPLPELGPAISKLIKDAAPGDKTQVRSFAVGFVARHKPAALHAVLASIPPGQPEHIAENRPPVTPGNDHGNRPTVPPGPHNYGRP